MSKKVYLNKKHEDMVGKVFDTNGVTKCVIIGYENNRKVIVKFLDSFGHEACIPLSDLRRGYVKNPFAPAVCGVGYLGIGKHSPSINGVKTLAYVQWHGVIRRSYDFPYKAKQKSYERVNVCDEWHCFDTYAEWFYKQEGWDKGYQLDKDILGDGEYLYSPETCCLVPVEINSLYIGVNIKKGVFSTGVYYSKKDKKFCSTIRKHGEYFSLGAYNTEMEAFLAYKTEKESYIKEVALLWRDEIEPRVYDALYNIEISPQGRLSEADLAFKFYEDETVEIPEYYLENKHLICEV
jgi:hypothetical protein